MHLPLVDLAWQHAEVEQQVMSGWQEVLATNDFVLSTTRRTTRRPSSSPTPPATSRWPRRTGELLRLPLFPGITSEQQEHVVATIRAVR